MNKWLTFYIFMILGRGATEVIFRGKKLAPARVVVRTFSVRPVVRLMNEIRLKGS